MPPPPQHMKVCTNEARNIFYDLSAINIYLEIQGLTQHLLIQYEEWQLHHRCYSRIPSLPASPGVFLLQMVLDFQQGDCFCSGQTEAIPRAQHVVLHLDYLQQRKRET